ncbi:MAG: PPC domain-containing DNA-binding protein [Pseudorhizobium sp.]
MQTKLLHENDGKRTFAAILETGDEVMSCLETLARTEKLDAAQITAIGAFQNAVVTYFDWEKKEYEELPVRDQVEVASLNGDIGVDEEGKPSIHIHLVLGKRDGSAVAGHLKQAHVRPTLEVIVTESPAHLVRHKDEVSGLNLIRF